VNDTHGHSIGDKLLIEVGSRLHACAVVIWSRVAVVMSL